VEISDEIVPQKSLGGISLGEQIYDVVARLPSHYAIHHSEHITTIDDGLITAYHDVSGIISALSCNSKFKGNYLNKLWPGMTVAEVIKNSTRQVAWSGFVQVDRIEGIGLSLPEERDDFDHLTDEFDHDYVFEELWVYE
jgi:hypothetical protein